MAATEIDVVTANEISATENIKYGSTVVPGNNDYLLPVVLKQTADERLILDGGTKRKEFRE